MTKTKWRKIAAGVWESPSGRYWRIELEASLEERLARFCMAQGRTRNDVLNAALREGLGLAPSKRTAPWRPAIARAAAA